jgi:hypothetical protein
MRGRMRNVRQGENGRNARQQGEKITSITEYSSRYIVSWGWT